MDLNICRDARLLTPNRHARTSNVLGHAHVKQVTRRENSANNRKISIRDNLGTTRSRRVPGSAFSPILDSVFYWHEPAWTGLRPYLSHGLSDRGRPLSAAHGDRIRAFVFHCPDWRDDVSLGS